MNRWPTKPLGEVLEVSRERIEPAEHPDTLFNYVGLENIEGHSGDLLPYGVRAGADIKSTKNVFHQGEILYGKLRPYLNKVHLADGDGICSTDIYVLRPRQRKIHPAFAANYLRSPSVLSVVSNAMAGANLPRIGQETLLRIPVAVPPMAEQQRIAKLLHEADELRKLRAGADRRTADLIPALFSEMFGDPFGSPRGWPVVQVQEAGRVQLGRQRAPKYQTGKFTRPYVRVANVFEDEIDVTDLLTMDFDGRDFRKYQLEYGDILLNEGQSTELVGRPAMWRNEVPECCFQNTLVRFQSDGERVLPDFALGVFLAYFRQGRFAQISSKTSNVAHLGASRFGKMPFPLPPVSVQTKFADRVSNIRNLQIDQTTSRSRLAELVKSLLHEAFGA